MWYIQGTAVFDFTGTTPEVYGNCNAPRAVTLSAIIYCLRCMVGHDVPLNQVFCLHYVSNNYVLFGTWHNKGFSTCNMSLCFVIMSRRRK